MQYIKSVPNAQTRSSESKDCAVRALASAAVMDYDEAHELLAYYGRPDRRACVGFTLVSAYVDAGFRDITVFGSTSGAEYYRRTFKHSISRSEKGITLKNFCKTYNKGRYIVSYKGHAVAVVNGEVIDIGSNLANKRVMIAFKR
tara:strand:+ start:1005 stop:1436 length:432 start_codon:yes stop_codon:yes gene_type:complete